MERHMLAIFITVGIVLSQSFVATADDRTESEQHFRAGIRLVNMEDFDGARVEFERSVELHPTKSGLFNLANAYKALHRYSDSLKTLERIKAEFGDKLNEKLSSSVEAMIEEIEAVTAQLEIRVPIDGVLVYVDGKPVGETPLNEQLIVGPGEHIVMVRIPEREVTQAVSVVSGGTEVVDITMPEDSPPPPPAEPIAEEQQLAELEPVPEPSKLKPWKWTSLAVTGALGITSGIFWGLAASKQTERDEMTDPTVSSADERQDTLDQGETFNKLAVGFSIGTAAFAALTTVLFILDRDQEQPTTNNAIEIGATPGQLTIAF